MSSIAKDDDKAVQKVDTSKMRLWNKGDAGQWAMSREGIAGTYFAAADDIAMLLDRFEAGYKLVGKECGIDFDDLFAEWIKNDCIFSGKKGDKMLKRINEGLQESVSRQSKYEDAARIVDSCDLYQQVCFTRDAIADDKAESAAWHAALAAEAAVRMKGRSAERLLKAGFMHSVVAPAKKTEWHKQLVKAAKRAKKTGIPERRLVGLMHEQFSEHSASAIRRALKKYGLLT